MRNVMNSGWPLFDALRKLGGMLLGLAALSGAQPGFAQGTPDQTLFGPKQYVRSTGSPDQYTDSFSVPSSIGAPFLLRIVNGNANGANRLSSAWIKVNGVQVAGPADFSQKVALIERSVNLGPSNTLEVRLTSGPEGYLTITALGTWILPVPTTLAPNPLTITAGATGNLTATLAPAPTSAGTLMVTSANNGVASVPASVPFGPGQTAFTIPVSGVASGTTTVTATANGGSASATVNVNPAPVAVTSLTPSALTLTQGANGTLTVTISAAQATDITVALASSNSGVAFVPSGVTLPAGSVSAPVIVNAVSPGTAQITSTLNASSASSQVTVTAAPPTVVSLVPVTATVTLGASTSLTLSISAAQATDTIVPLATDPAGIISVPASVTVPAGQTTVTVPVLGLALGQAGVTAAMNGTMASSLINVVPPPPQVTALEPATHVMSVGATSIFTVRINAAQLTNTEIALSVDNPAVLAIPASVTVAQGQTSATFTATAAATGDAVITAAVNNTQKTSTVHVAPQPAAIVSLLPNPLPLQQGSVGSLTVTINVAQETDTVISLANSVPAIIQVPGSVTIPAGAVSATVPVTALTAGLADVTAAVNGTSATSQIEVTPPPPVVTSITPATLTLPKGVPGVLRVTVSNAPNVATAIQLVSSNPGAAQVPATVNVAAGNLFADFPVAALSVGQATITASLNGGSATAQVTVAPAELTLLTLSPAPGSAYIGETVQFTATGTMTDGTTQDFTARVTWTSANAVVATIASAGVASALTQGQTTITASFSYTTAQAGQTVTITASTVLTVKSLVALVLSAPTLTLQVGNSATVTVSSSDPAPTGGLLVTLTQSGTGAASFPPTVTIPANDTSASFTLTATAAGQQLTVMASAANRLPGSIIFIIQPQLAISGFEPTSGAVGTAVTISGIGFNPVAGNNQVRFNGESAVIVSGNATTLNAIVPLRATTGPITVTNSLGTAMSATSFTVQEREAFDINLWPATTQVPPGGNGATSVKLVSTGLNPYPYAAAVTVSGLPTGVTAVFDRAAVALGQDAILTLTATAMAAAGSYPVTITAVGQSGVTILTRTKTLNFEVLAAGGTTVTGRVLHADDGAPFVGARVRLSTAQAFTDETGTYRFVSPAVTGDQVLLIDGHTNNTSQVEFPSAIAMPVMIVAGQDNKVLTSYIQKIDATKFTSIVPGAAATVTNPDLPNFSLNIPSGATLFGWDGQPIDKVNVRVVAVDRLPIRPIPAGQTSRSVYLFYFFREGGANPTTPIPVTMANDVEALPGQQVEMWYYDESPTPDPNSNQWRLMGMGTVSADGKSVVSNPGVGIPRFCCGAARLVRPIQTAATGSNAGNGCGPQTPYPVDLGSGNAMVFRPRPFGISKFMSVDPNCRYRSTDTRIGLFGRGMSFSYDWFAEVFSNTVRVTNPGGAQFILSLEADGKYRSRSGRSGSIEMEVTPTAGGRTLKLADGTQYDFDTAGRLRAIKDLNGNTTSFQLNAQGFPVSMTDAAGKVYQFQYVGSATNLNISQISDPAGRVIRFEYDASRRLIRYHDQGGHVTQLEYDANNRISRKTDPRNAVESIEYDAAGRATRELLPENGIQQFAYSTVGSTVTETRHTGENNNVTIYRWNGLGFLTQKIDALGRVTRYELDPVNNLLRRTIDPAGRVTQYFYNARGDLIRTVDADNQQTLIDYDARFRKPTRIENALGNVTTMVYDAKGNLTSLTNAENETTTFTYTAKGQLETVTDPLTRVTRFTYDANGNLLTATNPANETVTRGYDLANRLTEVTDALNRITRFTYDNLDRVSEVRDAAAGFTRFAYDANDNLLSAADPNNNPVERNLYDLRNRLKQRTDAKNRNTFYDYDGVGNLIRMTNRKGQVTEYRYDAINRVIEVRDAEGRATTYDYDLAGNLARISDSQTGDILMSYDALNRLIEVVTPQGTIQYAYDAIGRRTSRTISGGDVTAYTYDKVNRLKTVTLRGRTATYNYDLAGRLTEKILPNGLKATYQYDAADRVTNIAYTKPDNSTVESVGYSYDAGGQRLTKTQGQASPGETPFTATYDEANRLTQIALNGEPFTLGYDDNGNLATKSGPVSGTTTYTWNARNQLASISGPLGNATFKYDALGRRIEKTINGDTTGFLYDGAQAIAELKSSALDTVYHTGMAIDEVLARYGASGNKTLLTDALTSVIAQANDDQSVANFYAYSPYGQAITLGPDGGNSLQYTGRENDGTGLYYYRARYYDPVLKRFISEDPIGMMGGVNYFAYVEGNPISYTDPRGLDATRLINTSGGRSIRDGPTNGNWGGKCWSGGAYSCGANAGGNAPPTDSGDACYQRHDNCFVTCGTNAECLARCNRTLVDELRALPDDPRTWPQPPRPGTDADSRRYRNWAIQYFQ